MMSLEEVYKRVRSTAKWAAWRGGRFRQEADVCDDTQGAFARFLEKGMQDRIDSTKGSAESLLRKFLGFVSLESAREGKREMTVLDLSTVAPVNDGQDPLEVMLANERVQFVVVWLGKLTTTERTALARFYGPRIGPLESSVYAAKHRAIKRLRSLAVAQGLLDERVRPPRREKRSRKPRRSSVRRSALAERGITCGSLSPSVDTSAIQAFIDREDSVDANLATGRTASY